MTHLHSGTYQAVSVYFVNSVHTYDTAITPLTSKNSRTASRTVPLDDTVDTARLGKERPASQHHRWWLRGEAGQLLEDVGDVWCSVGFGDVVGFGHGGIGVAQLGGGVVGGAFTVEQGGDSTPETVRRDPLEVGAGQCFAQLAAEVVR